MKTIFLSAMFLLGAWCSQAQKLTPLYEAYFSHPDDMIQDEEGGYYFTVDKGMKVFMSDDGYYKLTSADGTLLEEGDTDEGESAFVRHGKWIEYYPSGKMKASGNYFHDQPYGRWQLFDQNGLLVSEADILPIINDDGTVAYCKAGTELVYYEDGKIKEERYFKAEPYMAEDKVMVEDPQTGKKAWSKVMAKAFRPQPFGTWVFYNKDGTVERKEDKKN